ncbi:MAG: beta strand repeat-containing protein, partial [Paracraurococcus sp.]
MTPGADSILGNEGNDTLVTGAGDDTISGGDGDDSLDGGGGTDSLQGSAGNDSIVGGADADSLLGGTGADTLQGDAGDDVLTGEAGADSLVGGAGTDTASYTESLTAADIAFSGGAWQVTAGGSTDALGSIEFVDGAGAGRFVLVGGGGFASIADAIAAAASGDTIVVAAGTWALPGGDSGKQLTFVGANAGVSANDASGDPNAARQAETIIDASGGTNFRFSSTGLVTFDGFTFTGVKFDAYDTGTDIALRNNIFTDPAVGQVLFAANSDTVTFVGNRVTLVDAGDFDLMQLAGNWNGTTGTTVDFSGNVVIDNSAPGDNSGFNLSSVTGTITDNIIDGISYYGFLLANDTAVTVSGNTFQNIVNPDPGLSATWGSGVRTYTPGTLFSLTLTDNTFTDNYIGLGIRDGSPTDITATGNSFSGNTFDVLNRGLTAVTINNADASDSIFGGTVNDTLAGTAFDDVLFGGAGNDSALGGAGADTLQGDAGDDVLTGEAGADSLVGGAGTDTASYTESLTAADIAFSGGAWQVTAGGSTDALGSIEFVDGAGAGRFVLVGGGGFASIADAIAAAASGDTIVVAAGTWALPGGDSGKQLTFVGANAGVSANDASGDPNAARQAETIIDASGGTNFRFSSTGLVTFDGFTFTGVKFDAYDTGTDIALRNNIFTDPAVGQVLFAANSDTVTFVGNRVTLVDAGDFDLMQLAGNWNGTTGTTVDFSGNVVIDNSAPGDNSGFNLSSVTGTITDNIIDGISYYGFLLANDTAVTVSGNTFQNIVNPDPGLSATWGSGVRTYTPGTLFSLTLTDNTFTDNYIGLGIRDGSPTDITATGNSFSGNTFDVLNRGLTAVTINNADASDSIFGGTVNDTLAGTAFDDVLFGGAGNDSALGGAGADTLTGGAGNDSLTGGD